MPLFSVIIPTYNRLHFLKETLASVQAQTFTDYEIIVVDDGSTDDTWDYLQTLAPAIRSFRQENKGPGAARNLGAQHATGTYLTFLDSDDLWFPWTLATFHHLIEQHHHPALLCGKTHLFQHPTELTSLSPSPIQAAYHPSILQSTELLLAIGAGITCIQRTLFLQAGGYNPSLHAAEDHDFALRIALAPGYVQIHSPPTLAYRRHSQNITENPQKILEGKHHLINSEKNNLYPGGPPYKKKRIHFIIQHLIPANIMILRSQYILPSLSLYLTTLPWAISSKRWKYLIGFPPLFLLYTLKTLLLAPKQLNPFPIAFTLLKATQSRLRNLLYRLLGVNITGYAWLQKISIPRNWADITIEKNAALDLGVVLLASGPPKKNKIHIHSGVYINRYTILNAHQSILIEPNVMIGPHTYITDADHGLQKNQLINVQPMTIRPVRIEQDAWIGAHVTILKGVTIGRGAIIAAGAVVTKNVEPYAIYAGIPAKKISQRPE